MPRESCRLPGMLVPAAFFDSLTEYPGQKHRGARFLSA